MQSYIEDGCRNIHALIQYSQESFSTCHAHEIQVKLSQIKIFFDDISSNLNLAEMTMNCWRMTRILLLVRRISRTLKHIAIECQRKKKCFEELTVSLANVSTKCERINIVEQNFTNHKLQELRQFEDELQYEKILYGREIIRQKSETKVDIAVLTLYLTYCITDNSFLRINGLIEDFDEFLRNDAITANVENQENLKRCLNQLQIPLEFFLSKLQCDTRTQIEREHLRQELGLDRNLSSHIDEHILHRLAKKDVLSLREKSTTMSITDILKSDRYIIVLGDPASGKSTFVRFVTRNLATNLLNSVQTIGSEPTWLSRIPVLIHLALFAKECAEKESLSILDYIENRENERIPEAGKMLKAEIMKGNCLLLFDGLDEVFTFESRHRVVHCVKSFIEQFALSPSFISPFDSWRASIERCLNCELPSETNGNQVIMTSRFIGYDATSLMGHSISHYIIPPLEAEEQFKFIDHWYSHVHESVNKILLSYNVSGFTNTNTSGVVYAEELKNNIKRNATLFALASNLILLSMICAWQYRSMRKPVPILRIDLYQEYVASTLRSRRLLNKGTMSEDIMHWILEDVAAYMHKEESSGVIDRFVLKRVCVHSLKAFYKNYEKFHAGKLQNLELEVDEFIRLIDQNSELLVARGQQIYGFIQMTFQEYFACLRLVRNGTDETNIQKILETLLAHIRKPRFLLPVLLGLEWLSCNWAPEEFNGLCQQLVSHGAKKQQPPVGAMLLIEVYKNLNQKPEKSIIYDAFDQFAHAHSCREWFFHHPLLGEEFCSGLDALPTAQSSQWLLFYLQKAASYEIVDLCFLIHRYAISASEFPEWLDADVCMLLSTYIQHDINNNEYAVEQLLCLIAERKYERLWKIKANSKGLDKLINNIAINQNQHHPLILVVIIALHGGLHGKEFNSLYIHRDSVLSTFIAEYYDRSVLPHTAKVTLLLERCDLIIHENRNNDISLAVLDAFTTLLCLTGMQGHDLCKKYKFHSGFHTAIRRLKNTLFYLRKRCDGAFTDFSIDDEYLATLYASSNVACRTVLGSVRPYNGEEEDTTSGCTEFRMLASEYMLAFMDAIAISLTSINLSIDHERIEFYEPFSLFKWTIPLNFWTDELRHFVTEYDLPCNIARVIPEWISFLSMIIFSEDYIPICCKDKKCVHKRFMQSVYDRTHIFYHTKDHPLFLISFIRPHRRALFCRFIATNLLNKGASSSDDWMSKMAYVYLLVECLDDFPRKNDNNICVLAFLILLLEPTLNANGLQHFIWIYFLKFQPEQTATLKNFLSDVSNLFPWAQALKSFDSKSALDVLEEQRHFLRKALMSDSGSQRDFELYTVCISLVHLSTIQFEDGNVFRDSLLKEVQASALKIDTPFYKAHALSYCMNANTAEFLGSLPSPFYFLLTERFCQDVKYFNDAIERLNCLFHDSNNTDDQQSVCEALLPLKCFRNYILDNGERFLRQNNFLMLSRALRIKSPVLHLHLQNTNDFWCDNPSISIITFHACLYLVLLITDAQSVLDAFEERPIASLDLFNITQKLKPSGYPPRLSRSQAHDISEYLEMAYESSKLEVLERALHLFDEAETDAYPYIRQWLQCRESSDLKLFAYHASILLPIENILQIYILVDIFQSDNDDFLRKVRDKHFTISLSSDPSLLRHLVERMTQIFRCNTGPLPFSFLKRLIIDRIELLLELFQAEQRLIYEKLQRDHTEHVLEASQDEQQVIWEQLQTDPSILRQFVLNANSESLAQTFILEMNSILDETNVGLLSTVTDRCLYLLSLEESFEQFSDFITTKVQASKRIRLYEETLQSFRLEDDGCTKQRLSTESTSSS